MYKLVVLASGNGSNFEEIVKQTREKYNDIEVSLLVSNRKKAYVLNRARLLGIPYVILSKQSPFEHLEEVLKEVSPDLVVLAGFMRIIPEWFVNKYFGKIVNLHPSLLPSFPGKDAIAQAWHYGVKITGITIHLVDSGVDTGPIIFQFPVLIDNYMTLEILEKKIHQIEHVFYTPVINTLLKCPWTIRGRKVTFTENGGDACAILRTITYQFSTEIWGKSP